MKKIGMITALLAGCLWGVIGFFVRYFTDYGIDGSSCVGIRAMFSSILFGLIILIKDRSLFKIKLKDAWIFLFTGFGCAIGVNLFYNVAIIELSLSLAAVLLSTMPVFVIILSRFVFKEKITTKKFICMAMVFVGCVFVSGIIGGSIGNITARGIIFGLLSGLGYAFYSMSAKVAANHGYNQFTTNFYTFLIAFIVFSFFTDWTAVGNYIALAPFKGIIMLVLHSLLAAVLPYILYSISIKHLEAGIAAIFASVEPVAAMVTGMIFENEMPTIFIIFGMFLVIVAVGILGFPTSILRKKKEI